MGGHELRLTLQTPSRGPSQYHSPSKPLALSWDLAWAGERCLHS